MPAPPPAASAAAGRRRLQRNSDRVGSRPAQSAHDRTVWAADRPAGPVLLGIGRIPRRIAGNPSDGGSGPEIPSPHIFRFLLPNSARRSSGNQNQSGWRVSGSGPLCRVCHACRPLATGQSGHQHCLPGIALTQGDEAAFHRPGHCGHCGGEAPALQHRPRTGPAGTTILLSCLACSRLGSGLPWPARTPAAALHSGRAP